MITCAATAERKSNVLIIDSSRVENEMTRTMQQVKLHAKNNGSFQDAMISAGYYARKIGKTMFVYPGNSYGHMVFRVSYKKSEYLNGINNTGPMMYSVDPDLTVRRHELSRG